MGKRQLHHLYVRLRQVRYAYLVAAVVVCGTIFAFSYRHNNLEAIHLRDTLMQADKNNSGVATALDNLRRYTYSHMNADLGTGGTVYPPIQLKYTYERLVDAEKVRVDTASATLYTDAQNYCEKQITSRLTTQRVPCIQSYLATHSVPAARTIPDAMYKFDFVSPAWSPDLAGWSLLATVIVLIALTTRIALDVWLRYKLRD